MKHMAVTGAQPAEKHLAQSQPNNDCDDVGCLERPVETKHPSANALDSGTEARSGIKGLQTIGRT